MFGIRNKLERVYLAEISEAEDTLKAHPNYPDVHNRLGLVLEINGQVQQAEEAYRKATVISPAYAAPRFNLFCLYTSCGRFEEAETELNAITRLKSASLEARLAFVHSLFCIKRDQDDTEGFTDSYRKTLQIDANMVVKYDRLHVKAISSEIELSKKALDAIKKYKVMEHQVETHYQIGLKLAHMHHTNKAFKTFDKAYLLWPEEGEYYNFQGLVHSYASRPDDAIKCFKKALDYAPDTSKIHSNLAFEYGVIGKIDLSLEELQKATICSHQYADLHNSLGMIFTSKQLFHAAEKEFLLALEINPNYIAALENLAAIYEKQDQMDKARKKWREIIEISPKNRTALKRLEEI